MNITAEVSLYPLKDNYESVIIDFIKKLKAEEGIHVYTHSMSTFVKGESTLVFTALDTALQGLQGATVSMVVKLINRELPVEKGFLEFS